MHRRDSDFDAFLAYLQEMAAQAPSGWPGSVWFLLRISEDCAGIRMQEVMNLLRFLRQMAGAPPRQFGPDGFHPDLVDDLNPARHYIAFVFVGFWLPTFLAMLMLYAWEVAGFIRYRGYWSPKDVRSGQIGVLHGRWLRRTAPVVLPGLTAGALAAPQTGNESAAQPV
ncbi:MAG: hypothetical protein ACK47M_07780 [Caldilinea sp.]